MGTEKGSHAVLINMTIRIRKSMKNETIDIMSAHRSIRSYTDEMVSDKELNGIVRAVQAAPNWVNLQLVSMMVVRDTERRKLFADLCGHQPHIA